MNEVMNELTDEQKNKASTILLDLLDGDFACILEDAGYSDDEIEAAHNLLEDLVDYLDNH